MDHAYCRDKRFVIAFSCHFNWEQTVKKGGNRKARRRDEENPDCVLPLEGQATGATELA
jgi:hypothetical protein